MSIEKEIFIIMNILFVAYEIQMKNFMPEVVGLIVIIWILAYLKNEKRKERSREFFVLR